VPAASPRGRADVHRFHRHLADRVADAGGEARVEVAVLASARVEIAGMDFGQPDAASVRCSWVIAARWSRSCGLLTTPAESRRSTNAPLGAPLAQRDHVELGREVPCR